MSQNDHGLRTCPTRIDSTPVLFAHRVSTSQCQDRQRGKYHKCFTCVHNNTRLLHNGVGNLAQDRSSKRKVARVG